MANGKPTLVLGLGITGLSCARFLAANDTPNLKVLDTRAAPPMRGELLAELPHVEVVTGPFDEELLVGAAQLVVSPGLDLRTGPIAAAIAAGVPVTSDLDLFCAARSAPVVAITGSNGKSTITSLIASVLQQAGIAVRAGGNLGTAVLDLLGPDEPEYYVLELSSFQLERSSRLRARVAVLANVTEDHLDRYDSFEDYRSAKQRIYCGAEFAVFNRDDPATRPDMPHDGTSFGLGEAGPAEFGRVRIDGEWWLARGSDPVVPASALRIRGEHNQANALAAMAAVDAIGIPADAIRAGLEHFGGLPHRSEWVASHGDVAYVNDSKGTNPGATRAALSGLAGDIDGRIVLIAGGQGKGADFAELAPLIERHCRSLVLIGEDARLIDAALGRPVKTVFASDMQAAIALAARMAQPGDAVLLSPACASFDMFDSFEHRGQVFTDMVLDRVARHD